MESNLIDYIKDKNNIPLIWKEYLPNDILCQTNRIGKVSASVCNRTKYCNKILRCKYCLNENSILNSIRIENVRPKCKYYGSMKGRYSAFIDKVGSVYKLCCMESEIDKEYIGLDEATCSILGHELLEGYGGSALEKVYKCSNRVTLQFHRDIQDKTYCMVDVVKQLQDLISKLNQFRFSFGKIMLDTICLVNGKIRIKRLRNPSFDVPNTEHRIGPIIDDTDIPSLTVFSIVRCPTNEVRHYYRLKSTTSNIHPITNMDMEAITKYGIPIVYYSLDFYRLVISLMINSTRTIMDMSSDNWFKSIFLPSEHDRIVKRLEWMREVGEKDMFHALYDSKGSFSLRCDVLHCDV